MRLKVSKSKNAASFYVTKSIYENKKEKTVIVEKLGTEQDILKKSNGVDPYVWAKNYIAELNKQEKENSRKIMLAFSQSEIIPKHIKKSYNGGYLFLQSIFYKLAINKICRDISNKYKFEYDLENILARLIYSRIIYPTSKLRTYELSKKFIEKPNFELHDLYRSLDVIAKEKDFIQSELYKNSIKYKPRNDKILYYDCTNFFFEIQEANGLKQYGKSKENRPNPIVQMGLFLDGDGIPLAFNITPGNTNEQTTLRPLEKQIISDFKHSKFVVCTDAGLSSTANRKFNNTNNRRFITTQSIKKLKGFLKEEAIDLTKGWKISGSDKIYDISSLREDEQLIEQYKDTIFYKQRWINEDGLEQRLIVTYSVKYQEYQKKIRENQVQRADKLIENKRLTRTNANDPKRFVTTLHTTDNGELAEKKNYYLNEEAINQESIYDGLYAVCTNLEDDVEDIIKVNKGRWEIEETFRMLKSEFKARPVYVSNEDRIIAHFTTCFLALTVFRYLEKELDEKYSINQIIKTLRDMNFYKTTYDGYIPIYERTDITDTLHEKFSFRTDYEIISEVNMKKIFKQTKK